MTLAGSWLCSAQLSAPWPAPLCNPPACPADSSPFSQAHSLSSIEFRPPAAAGTEPRPPDDDPDTAAGRAGVSAAASNSLTARQYSSTAVERVQQYCPVAGWGCGASCCSIGSPGAQVAHCSGRTGCVAQELSGRRNVHSRAWREHTAATATSGGCSTDRPVGPCRCGCRATAGFPCQEGVWGSADTQQIARDAATASEWDVRRSAATDVTWQQHKRQGLLRV